MSAEQSEIEKVQEALILSDRALSHAVEVIMVKITPGANREPALEIAQAITRIKERAERANMFAFQPSIMADTLFDDADHFLVITIMVPWADKDELERNARQQALTQGSGPRRVS